MSTYLDEIIKRGLIKDLKPVGSPDGKGAKKTDAAVKLTSDAPVTTQKKKCC